MATALVAANEPDADEGWMDARTVLGAPSFAVLAAERAASRSGLAPAGTHAAPADLSPARRVSGSDAISAPTDLDAATLAPATTSEVAPRLVAPELDASFEAVATETDAPSFPSIEIPIDVDEPEPVALEVSIARQSESAIWEGLDGEVGVFLATYDELPIGTEVTLTVHLTGERPFETRARVVWLRNAPGLWPGLGLRLLENRPDVWFRIQRFSQRWRAPMFQ